MLSRRRQADRADAVFRQVGIADVNLGGWQVSYSRDNHNGSKFVEITIVGSGGEFKR